MGMLYEYDDVEREAMGLNQRSAAYHTGYQDAVDGCSPRDNPYAKGTWDAQQWLEGWNAY